MLSRLLVLRCDWLIVRIILRNQQLLYLLGRHPTIACSWLFGAHQISHRIAQLFAVSRVIVWRGMVPGAGTMIKLLAVDLYR